MSDSLLFHALSLNDRILEPNKLPIAGRVWAYTKEKISRDMFVGNCISMLSLLGIEDAEISWKDDIMAFDVSYQRKPATVIISLQDDSLASDYYYFLGIWVCPESDDPVRVSRNTVIDELKPGHDEDLIEPAMTYAVTLWDTPLQLPEMKRVVRSEVFGQRIYQDSFYLCGQTSFEDIPSARFVICPTTSALQHGRYEIQHALYSMRNLMALMCRSFQMYEQLQQNEAAAKLSQQMLQLMGKVEQKTVALQDWDDLVCEHARIALQVASETVLLTNAENELRGLCRLFNAIVGELCISEMKGIGRLTERMEVPFQHVEDVIHEQLRLHGRIEKQAQIMQPFIHSRMLANQQILLNKVWDIVKDSKG